GLHGGVIGDDHRGTVFNLADPRDYARRRRLAIVPVIRDQQADFEEMAARIEQTRDAFTGRYFPCSVLLVNALLSASFSYFFFQMVLFVVFFFFFFFACDN